MIKNGKLSFTTDEFKNAINQQFKKSSDLSSYSLDEVSAYQDDKLEEQYDNIFSGFPQKYNYITCSTMFSYTKRNGSIYSVFIMGETSTYPTAAEFLNMGVVLVRTIDPSLSEDEAMNFVKKVFREYSVERNGGIYTFGYDPNSQYAIFGFKI